MTTIGKLIDDNERVTVHCERYGEDPCRHFVYLDLEALAAKLGREHGAMHDDLARLFRCTRCGGRKVSFRRHPPTIRAPDGTLCHDDQYPHQSLDDGR